MRRRPLFYCAILLCGFIFLSHKFQLFPVLSGDISAFAQKSPGTVFLGGVVISEVDPKESFGQTRLSFDLECQKIWAEGKSYPVTGKVRALWKRPDPISYGDELVMEGEIALPKGPRNPGGFDQRAYLEHFGIRAVFFGGKEGKFQILRHDRAPFFQGACLKVKKFLCQKLKKDFSPEDAAFMESLFFGEKKDLGDGIKTLFLKTGTFHILAVSGFNIGFLIVTVFFFLKLLRVPKNARLLIALAIAWIYCFIVGWQAPVVRATSMATVLILGSLLGRKTDIYNSIGLAAILILAIQPIELFAVGFQLSFAAVLGMVAFSGQFIQKPDPAARRQMDWMEKTRFYLTELFWVSFVATMTTLPITVQNFYMVSPVSLLANLVVVPLSFAIFVAGVVYFFTFGWSGPFLSAVPWIVRPLMNFFMQSLRWMESLPWSSVTVGKLSPALWVVFTAGIFYFLWDPKIQNRWSRFFILSLFCANVFLLQGAVRNSETSLKVTFLDVGQGDSVYMRFPDGRNLLLDAGKGRDPDAGRWVVSPFLKSQGVSSLDLVAFSHPQEDHIGGMETVLEEFQVKNVLDPGRAYSSAVYRRIQKKIRQEKSVFLHPSAGDHLSGLRDCSVDFLHPQKELPPEKNINNDSLVFKVSHGKSRILLTGDIQSPAMNKILTANADLEADLLKVPHHGARMEAAGMEFVRRARPRFSVISVGERNPFKHPRSETLSILEGIEGNRILRTDREGAISFVSDAQGFAKSP